MCVPLVGCRRDEFAEIDGRVGKLLAREAGISEIVAGEGTIGGSAFARAEIAVVGADGAVVIAKLILAFAGPEGSFGADFGVVASQRGGFFQMVERLAGVARAEA